MNTVRLVRTGCIIAGLALLLLAPALRAQQAQGEDEAFLHPEEGAAKEGPPAPAAEEPVEKEPAGGAPAAEAPAAGAEPKPDEKAAKEQGGEEQKPPRDHKGQGFVNVLGGIGWFMVAPYDKDDPEKACDYDAEKQEGEPICTGMSGFHLDMLAGYAPLAGFEVFAIFRLGILRSPDLDNQPLVRQVGAGVKLYSPKDGLFKIGFGIAPLFDFSERNGDMDEFDFVIHVPIQAVFDIVKWFGAYIQVSPNISFLAEFRLEFTGGIGVQGRFP